MEFKVGQYVIFNDAEYARNHRDIFTLGKIYRIMRVEHEEPRIYLELGESRAGVYAFRVLPLGNIKDLSSLEKVIYDI